MNKRHFSKTSPAAIAAASVCMLAALTLLPGCDSGGSDSNNSSGPPTAILTLATGKIGQAGAFATNGDLLIGAPGANEGKGALLVVKSGATDFSDYITGEQAGDNLGTQVVALGDVVGDGGEYFAVSARFATGAAPLSGASYVYKYSPAAATPLILYVKLAGANAFDKFGESVAAGDFNGDGIRDIAVSAPFTYTDEAGYQSGRVTLYLGGSTLTARGSAPDATIAGDKVGGTVGSALAAGDITGDGIDELLISSASKVLVYAGRTDIVARLGTSITPDLKVRSDTGGKSGSGFGNSLAVIGDIDGDGIGDFAVGSPNRSEPATYDNTGSLYLFKGGAILPTEYYEDDLTRRLAKIVGENAADRFASSIAVGKRGDTKVLLVGARWATGTINSAAMLLTGDVYEFDLATVLADKTVSYSAGTHAAQRYPIAISSGEYGRNLAARNSEFFAGAPLLDGGQGRPYRKTIGASGSDDGSCCGD